ncbi:uncharacterized protein LOC130361225 isoform X4 [Hyla sarda]|uniref:uncharacterized protein LOC130361225 isoform X4 n=1 Tax=Hyla sarda TaxID=327740 RepID=UPI0024C3EAA5|nr:uncharacterized protein LOC130361225 isoform X4 [Hyla sarda]XP_056419949.1 uncharacterized protein LOC130361225 isoform X4 [Hyla sarda]XP_056419952.1 uncharacterized protein LOC130361225 isoform X4 [Hyla sarda]
MEPGIGVTEVMVNRRQTEEGRTKCEDLLYERFVLIYLSSCGGIAFSQLFDSVDHYVLNRNLASAGSLNSLSWSLVPDPARRLYTRQTPARRLHLPYLHAAICAVQRKKNYTASTVDPARYPRFTTSRSAY